MEMRTANEKSCGAVIYKYLGTRRLFLIAKMNHGHYSLIKGHVEDGESELMTAYREIKEETNLDVVIDVTFRHVISYHPYQDQPWINKDVVFFVATPVKGRIKKQEAEVDTLLWCSYAKALLFLTHDSDREVLKAAQAHLLTHPITKYEEEDLLRLTIPAPSYLPSYLQTKVFNEVGDGFVNAMTPNVLQRITNARHGIALPPGWVKGTYLWLVIRHEFIGEISIRHELTDGLFRFGGNIGYRIRHDQRKCGYGVKMLAMALCYIKEVIGLKKVLITCNDDNIGSIKVIERNGGRLFDKIYNHVDEKETLTRRYWVDVI